ncbi:hypothetical protein PJV93_07055 [Aliarcobacter butzleri]|uniref:Lipoprotein n=1 Tax=Aliarcobacter butzleri TaxID=28197 RepID=A0AAW7QB92_9BACT|nr:hypothetical protein [Aliarcobacter butzleri]MDN5107957.1 hypothetical protein [Aliarcobacter butzleri]MDN5123669.1 hypothetical protein [Aliarcobacter butzleri]
MKKVISLVTLSILALGISGCSYRNDSGVSIPDNLNAMSASNVLVTEDSLNDKNCVTIKEIDTSVKKLTVFHKDPTKEQANFVLAEQAKKIDANAVRNVKYSSGVGLTTWGYMDAKGDASKCDLK